MGEIAFLVSFIERWYLAALHTAAFVVLLGYLRHNGPLLRLLIWQVGFSALALWWYLMPWFLPAWRQWFLTWGFVVLTPWCVALTRLLWVLVRRP